MMVEKHIFGTMANSQFENMEVRITDLVSGEKNDLLRDLMVDKMSGLLVGYTMYDLTESEFYSANWQVKQDAIVAQWFDKDAFVGTPPGVSQI